MQSWYFILSNSWRASPVKGGYRHNRCRMDLGSTILTSWTISRFWRSQSNFKTRLLDYWAISIWPNKLKAIAARLLYHPDHQTRRVPPRMLKHEFQSQRTRNKIWLVKLIRTQQHMNRNIQMSKLSLSSFSWYQYSSIWGEEVGIYRGLSLTLGDIITEAMIPWIMQGNFSKYNPHWFSNQLTINVGLTNVQLLHHKQLSPSKFWVTQTCNSQDHVMLQACF